MSVHKRRLRNYLLDRGYQLRFTLIMVLISAVLTTGLGYFWYAEMRNASRVLEVEALANMGEEESRRLEAELARQDRRRLLVLVGFGLALALVMAIYGIRMTHRVAGPLYKIARHMGDVRDNRIYPLWGLRRGDQLRHFWKVFSDMHESLRRRAKQEVDALELAIATLEGDESQLRDSPDLAETVVALRAMRDAKLHSLEPASEETRQLTRDSSPYAIVQPPS